jgi:hypothetical protein
MTPTDPLAPPKMVCPECGVRYISVADGLFTSHKAGCPAPHAKPVEATDDTD